MPREPIETIASLVAKIKRGRAEPVDIMHLYKALQELPPADASRVIQETTSGEYMVVPTEPPAGWNPRKRNAYRIFLSHVIDWMLDQEAITASGTHQTAPDA